MSLSVFQDWSGNWVKPVSKTGQVSGRPSCLQPWSPCYEVLGHRNWMWFFWLLFSGLNIPNLMRWLSLPLAQLGCRICICCLFQTMLIWPSNPGSWLDGCGFSRGRELSTTGAASKLWISKTALSQAQVEFSLIVQTGLLYIKDQKYFFSPDYFVYMKNTSEVSSM